ncbi:hypothetical protein Tsubulata_041712, partial [Turnera subulata]
MSQTEEVAGRDSQDQDQLARELTLAVNALSPPPSFAALDLLPLLDGLELCLTRVSPSPSDSVTRALALATEALTAEESFHHFDEDVKVFAASCINQIMRIMASNIPYDANQMKENFKLIVAAFEKLSDTSSRSYFKRRLILTTVARTETFILMLSPDCYSLISEMFKHFFMNISEDDPADVFSSMGTIMILTLEELEEIPEEVLSPLRDSVRMGNQDVSPIARTLGKQVIKNCALKLVPYMHEELHSLFQPLGFCCNNGATSSQVSLPEAEEDTEGTEETTNFVGEEDDDGEESVNWADKVVKGKNSRKRSNKGKKVNRADKVVKGKNSRKRPNNGKKVKKVIIVEDDSEEDEESLEVIVVEDSHEAESLSPMEEIVLQRKNRKRSDKGKKVIRLEDDTEEDESLDVDVEEDSHEAESLSSMDEIILRKKGKESGEGKKVTASAKTMESLTEALVKQLPNGTIRYSSRVASIEDLGHFKLVHLADGTILKTKVLIGCDGVNSVVAKWLGFKKPAFSGRSAIRGCAYLKENHGLGSKFLLFFGNGLRSGFLPCDASTVYWFFTWTPSDKGDINYSIAFMTLLNCSSRLDLSPLLVGLKNTYFSFGATFFCLVLKEELQDNPAKMKQFVLSKLGNVPNHLRKFVEMTELDNLVLSPLLYRHPWEVLLGNISKGNVCVAGDALHPMTPDLGQGGCSALEDGVVLARCLGKALLKNSSIGSKEEDMEAAYKSIQAGLKTYANERRWRSFELITTAYLVGTIQQSSGARILMKQKA